MSLLKIFWAIVFSAILSACGGGGGGSSTGGSSSSASGTSTSSALAAYTGNLDPSAMNDITGRKFLQIIFSTDNFGGIASARAETTQEQSSGGSISNAQSLSSLAIAQLNNFSLQQRTINTNGNCYSGMATISGSIDDNSGTGTLDIRFNNCLYDNITLDGSAVFTIHSANVSKQIITSATMSMNGLSITNGGITYKATGTQRIDVNPTTYVTTITSNLHQINGSTQEETLLQNLVVVIDQYGEWTKISGTICHHTYGCASVITSSNFKTDALNGLPYIGSLTLTGLNKSSIQTIYSIDNKTGWARFILNIDANGDRVYETMGSSQSIKELTGQANTPPVAETDKASIITQYANSSINISAYASHDPDGDGISAEWSLTSRPAGSNASIQFSTSLSAWITPDALGVYAITLTITDERGASSQAFMTVELQRYNYSPFASITAPGSTAVNTTVMLDGSKSSDFDEDPLSFEWAITSKPAGSSATVLNKAEKIARFTPDIPGAYEISLTVDDGYQNGSDTAMISINVVDAVLSRLPHDTVDAEYSDFLDKAVIVASQPANKLYLTDLATDTESSVNLALPPTSVAVSPDGKNAVVGHDDGITLINLETLQIIATHLEIGFKVADITLKNTQKAYASDARYGWTSLYEIDLQTGLTTPHTSANYSPLYGNSHIKLQPGAENIYSIEQGLSPTDLKKFDVSSTPPAYLYDSPYHGDYPMGNNLWFSDDGAYILAAGGAMFRTSSLKSSDMQYLRSISTSNYSQYILAADHSANADKFVTVSNISDYYFKPRYAVRTYATPLLTMAETHEFDPLSLNGSESLAEPAFTFFNSAGTNYYVILTQDSDTFLMKY